MISVRGVWAWWSTVEGRRDSVGAWAVYVEFDDVDADELVCDQLTERLTAAFPDGGVSVGRERHRGGRLSVQVAVDVPDALGARAWRRALNDAVEEATRALRAMNRPTGVVDAQVTRWDEFERRLVQPVVPELITLSEAARLAGVSQQRMSQVAEDNPAFPPVVVAGTTLRVKRAVEGFLASWERRPGRRWPASSATPDAPAPHADEPVDGEPARSRRGSSGDRGGARPATP